MTRFCRMIKFIIIVHIHTAFKTSFQWQIHKIKEAVHRQYFSLKKVGVTTTDPKWVLSMRGLAKQGWRHKGALYEGAKKKQIFISVAQSWSRASIPSYMCRLSSKHKKDRHAVLLTSLARLRDWQFCQWGFSSMSRYALHRNMHISIVSLGTHISYRCWDVI